jgi:hypothetical protein
MQLSFVLSTILSSSAWSHILFVLVHSNRCPFFLYLYIAVFFFFSVPTPFSVFFLSDDARAFQRGPLTSQTPTPCRIPHIPLPCAEPPIDVTFSCAFKVAFCLAVAFSPPWQRRSEENESRKKKTVSVMRWAKMRHYQLPLTSFDLPFRGHCTVRRCCPRERFAAFALRLLELLSPPHFRVAAKRTYVHTYSKKQKTNTHVGSPFFFFK